jgi:HSP20 family molecular chaperone IbpA
MLVRRPLSPLDLSSAAFDRTFQQLVAGLATPSTRRTGPAVRATTSEGALTLTVDLPGVPAEAVGVEVADRTLTISAELDGSRWSSSTRLGGEFDLDSITATHVDGRLTVTVSAAPAPTARKIAVSTTPVVPAVEAGEATAEVPVEATATAEVSEG